MRRFGWGLAAVVLAWSLAGGIARGQVIWSMPAGGGRGGVPQKPYDEMVTTIKTLKAEQSTQIKAKYDALDQDLAAIEQARGDKLTDLIVQHGGTVPPGFAQTVQEALDKSKQDDAILTARYDGEINALLTPEQRATWEGHKLATALEQGLARLQLTAGQSSKLEALATETAKVVLAAKDDAAVRAAKGDLVKRVFADVLTEEQVTTVVGIRY